MIQQAITIGALLVILAVFWWLKLTGITIAGEAFCGKVEHVHSADCGQSCHQAEHVHDKTCYSDIRVDAETAEIWEASLKGMIHSGSTAEDVVAVAHSQMGYQESTRNFYVDAAGVRRGITRYGQWYGNPYGDWSAMFAAFCLHYAGVDAVPISGGSQAMQLAWERWVFTAMPKVMPPAGVTCCSCPRMAATSMRWPLSPGSPAIPSP